MSTLRYSFKLADDEVTVKVDDSLIGYTDRFIMERALTFDDGEVTIDLTGIGTMAALYIRTSSIITVKLTGGATFTVEEDLPADRKRSDIVREICEDLGPLVLEFEPKTRTTNSNVPIPKSAPAPSEPTPELDPAYLDTLGWTDFSPGPGQWIVAETTGAQALDEELTSSGQTIEIGTYRYRLSFGRPDKEGKRRKFINRYPAR
jgi:hypothetical protein